MMLKWTDAAGRRILESVEMTSVMEGMWGVGVWRVFRLWWQVSGLEAVTAQVWKDREAEFCVKEGDGNPCAYDGLDCGVPEIGSVLEAALSLRNSFLKVSNFFFF